MKPKQHTNYFHFPKKLKRMRKYVPKSKRIDDILINHRGNILANYRDNYLLTSCEVRFFEKISFAMKNVMLSSILMGNSRNK